MVQEFTNLFYILIEGRELVRILLAAGADATAQDAQHGRTALHTAAMADDVELVKVKPSTFVPSTSTEDPSLFFLTVD